MNADELQELIKKLLAKGVTVLVLVIGPAGQLMGVEPGDTAGPPAVGAEPNQPATGPGTGPGATPAIPDTGTKANPASPGPSTGAGTTPLPGTGQQDPPAAGGTGTPDTGAATPRAGGVATVPPTGTWSNANQRAGPQTGQNGASGTGAGGTGTGGGDVGDTRSDNEAGGSTGEGSGGAGDGGAGQTVPGPGRPGTGDPGQGDPDTGDAGTDGDTGTRLGNGGGEGAGGAGGGTDAGSGNGTTNGTGAPATGTGGGAGVSGGQGTTAAEAFGWGNAVRADDFTGGTEGWSIYDGPGHAGNGRRTPDAVSISDGVLTITGDAQGNTAGMAWNPGQKYGRWEGRVKAPAADPSYNALLLLWPDAENFPEGGEVDFMEMMDPDRRKTNLFLHYGADNSQVSGDVEIDATQWHNWAVEWTPDHIAAFVDGRQWWKTTDTSILPPGPMHLCIQLDWFPKGDGAKESTMQVDWIKQYALDGSSSGGTGRQPAGTGGQAGAGGPAGGGQQDGGEQAGTERSGGS